MGWPKPQKHQTAKAGRDLLRSLGPSSALAGTLAHD